MSSITWKVVWNTASQLVGKVVGSGAMLLISIMIAREFGAQGYGDFTKITTFVAFFYLFVDFGLNAVYLKRQTADNKQQIANSKGNADWATLLGIRIVGGVLLMFLAIALLSFLPQGETQGYTGLVRLGIILFSPTILIQGLIVSANAIFQKHLRYDLASLAIAAGNIVTVILVAFALYGLSLRIGVLGVTTSLLVGLGVTGIVSLAFVRRLERFIHISFHQNTAKTLFFAALPLGITLLFNQVYFRVDSLVLALTRSTTEVGLYGLAYKVFELPLVLPTFFMNSVYPLLLLQQAQNSKFKTQNFQATIKKSGAVLLLTSVIFSLAAWFTAPLLIYIRPEFSESISLLRILTLGLPFFFLSSLMMWTLIALGRQMALAVIYGSVMLVTVLLDILIIPIYGATGAAWITVGSEALVLFISGAVLQRYLRYTQNNPTNPRPITPALPAGRQSDQ
ncbi:flippase [Candidatus Gottesmanbacteria bacterium]|nr:flippase [Candidatus Gottesmanbacteria bacterium]